MDSTAIEAMSIQIPDLIAQNPKVFLIAWLIHAAIEFALPRIKGVRANDLPTAIIHAIAAGLGVLRKKG